MKIRVSTKVLRTVTTAFKLLNSRGASAAPFGLPATLCLPEIVELARISHTD
ncbi:hypothetical protein [Nostoc sp.]|uniref:hypothetical protein n=1 Tax=Nostoc sp. TaxID=1180 RepID=UPI002FF9AA1A